MVALEYILTGLISLVIGIYLMVALLKPDLF
jgi:K+-transporting ATPase KdpF subunit